MPPGYFLLPLKTDWRDETMKKNEIKDYMIVETGFDNKKYLVKRIFA